MDGSVLRIGFDVSQTGKVKAGCGFFAENLITELASIDAKNQYILYSTFGDHFWDKDHEATSFFNLPNFQKGLKHKSLIEAKNFWDDPKSNFEKQLGSVDIVHSNNFFCPKNIKSKLIYTLYDLSFIENPDYSTEHNRTVCFDSVFNASVQADLILAISHYSRNHFLSTFPHYPPERVVVTYPGGRFSQPQKITPRPEKLPQLIPNKFWLNVGTIEPRKNIKKLLQSYAKLKAQIKETHPLVLAGGKGWLMDDIEELIEKYQLQDSVHILGYTDNNDLIWLYRNCFCFLYPSLFEGFGLPVLEAMSFGAPVITSNISSIPEVTGDACILINPLTEDELFHAMLTISSNKEQRIALKEKGLKQASLFSWRTTAKLVQSLYQDVIKLPKLNARKQMLTHTLNDLEASL